jgi:hypothetical protein
MFASAFMIILPGLPGRGVTLTDALMFRVITFTSGGHDGKGCLDALRAPEPRFSI